MRLAVMFCTGLLLTAGGAYAQDGDAAPRPPAAATPAGAPSPPAAAIKPGSILPPRGSNGFGGSFPVPGLYRENPGNGLYGAYSGAYQGQM